jgi:hypothetical protein
VGVFSVQALKLALTIKESAVKLPYGRLYFKGWESVWTLTLLF